MNIGELKEILSNYSDTLVITTQFNDDIVCVESTKDGRILISTGESQGTCKTCGDLVYLCRNTTHLYFCPHCDIVKREIEIIKSPVNESDL